MTHAKIELFAGAKEAMDGQSCILVQLPASEATATEILHAISAQYPCLESLANRSRLAVNNVYASPVQQIDCQSAIALIPPVSGG